MEIEVITFVMYLGRMFPICFNCKCQIKVADQFVRLVRYLNIKSL